MVDFRLPFLYLANLLCLYLIGLKWEMLEHHATEMSTTNVIDER